MKLKFNTKKLKPKEGMKINKYGKVTIEFDQQGNGEITIANFDVDLRGESDTDGWKEKVLVMAKCALNEIID